MIDTGLPMADELALLREIATGVREVSILEDRYKPRLLWFARVMGVPGDDSADLVQDVFLVAIREIRCGRFRHESSVITWLDGILKNKIKDFWRAQDRRRSIFISLEPVAANGRSVEKFVTHSPARWDANIDVRAVLERMPGELRVILLLNETEGLTVDEISRKLKKRPGTVGRKLAEARRIFRDRLIEARLGALRCERAAPQPLKAPAG
jgi:RNA polymerase sigma factor (sigma-70 family)